MARPLGGQFWSISGRRVGQFGPQDSRFSPTFAIVGAPRRLILVKLGSLTRPILVDTGAPKRSILVELGAVGGLWTAVPLAPSPPPPPKCAAEVWKARPGAPPDEGLAHPLRSTESGPLLPIPWAPTELAGLQHKSMAHAAGARGGGCAPDEAMPALPVEVCLCVCVCVCVCLGACAGPGRRAVMRQHWPLAPPPPPPPTASSLSHRPLPGHPPFLDHQPANHQPAFFVTGKPTFCPVHRLPGDGAPTRTRAEAAQAQTWPAMLCLVGCYSPFTRRRVNPRAPVLKCVWGRGRGVHGPCPRHSMAAPPPVVSNAQKGGVPVVAAVPDVVRCGWGAEEGAHGEPCRREPDGGSHSVVCLPE